MPAVKKRNIYDEGRVFNSQRCSKYLVVTHNQGVVCLACQKTIANMKEYNVKRHYATKHSSNFDEIIGQTRVDKIKHFKNPLKTQGVFTTFTQTPLVAKQVKNWSHS